MIGYHTDLTHFVFIESLRKWPPAMSIDRKCVKPYKYVNNDGTKLTLNVGDTIWIPVLGIHRDSEYYPNPDKFDPERFSDENKHKILPFTYLPFGSGPRNCIGNNRVNIKFICLITFLFVFKVHVLP